MCYTYKTETPFQDSLHALHRLIKILNASGTGESDDIVDTIQLDLNNPCRVALLIKNDDPLVLVWTGESWDWQKED